MAEAKTESLFSYNIELKIKDKDYSTQLEYIRIVSCLAIGYQVLEIVLGLNANDPILNKIYGQDLIKLTIKMHNLGEKTPIETVDMELMILETDSSMPVKISMSDGKQYERSPFTILAIPRKPYEAMWSKVNKKFNGKTPMEIVEAIVPEVAKCTLVADKEDKNTSKIDTVMISPSTLYQAIYYLDHSFGLYNGAGAYFCQYDNKFYVMNLSKKMTKNEIFTIHHLATDSKEVSDILKKASKGKDFYTYTPLSCNYSANSAIGAISKIANMITKPSNKLSKTKKYDLITDVIKKSGATDKNNKIYYDSILDNRITYVNSDAGYGDGELSTSGFTRQILNLVSMKLTIGKNLPIINLLKVGEVVKVNTLTEAYVNSSGKYLLKSSDIVFQKVTGGWLSNCNLELIRTNKDN